MYQVLFNIDKKTIDNDNLKLEWFHLDGMFLTLDKAIEKAYGLKNGFYTARFIGTVEIVKLIIEDSAIVSRELIKSY